MSAIAGVWYPDGRPGAKADCQRISRSLALYGPDREGQWDGGEIAFAHRLMAFLPEDRFHRQPLAGRGGRLHLVADCRIDNREELGRLLSIDPARQAVMCDAAFILAALERWGAGAVDRLCGDFAFAAWDMDARTLMLARDPVGNRPLHYHVGCGWFAFASMPKGLLALPEVPTGPDPDRVLTWQMLLPLDGPHSFYKGVQRLDFGHVATVRADGGMELRRYWDPMAVPQRRGIRGNADADGMRDALDVAVKAQLRGTGGTALMLSGGLDSCALASSAAPLLAEQGKRLSAYTNVPVAGEDSTYAAHLLTDEGPLAAARISRINILLYDRSSGLTCKIQYIISRTSRPFRGMSSFPGVCCEGDPHAAAMAGRTGNWRVVAVPGPLPDAACAVDRAACACRHSRLAGQLPFLGAGCSSADQHDRRRNRLSAPSSPAARRPRDDWPAFAHRCGDALPRHSR